MLTFQRCIADVADFHAKFGIDVNPLDDADQYDLRVKRQQEEFDEAADATDSAEHADAVIDIIYIAAGTVHLLGDRDGGYDQHVFVSKDVLAGIAAALFRQYKRLPLEALWEEVHSANMRKERGTEGTSKYKNKFDIVKPEGWTAPNIARVLVEHGLDPAAPADAYYDAQQQ